MIKRYHIVEGKVVENGDVSSPVSVYINPTEDERKYLVDILKIDEHDISSALDPNELGRVEFEPDHTILIIKRPKRYSSEDNFLLKISSIGLFLFHDKLIILLGEESEIFDGRNFNRVRSVSDLLLKIINRCIQHFIQHLQVIHAISDELEAEVNLAMTNQHLLSMFNLEKSLVYYVNSISSNSKVIDKLRTNHTKLGLSVEELDFLEDLAIEGNQCYEQANTYSEVLSSMMDAWASVVSNNLNILIKKLTIVMIAIQIPTLIVSIFSMNVLLPIDQHVSHLSFWFIISLAFLSFTVVLFIRKWKKL